MKRSGLPKCSRIRRRRTGPTCGQLVEDRGPAQVGVATLPMVRHGEAVRLVADALQEERAGVVGRQRQRVAAAGHEDLLALLGEADEVHVHASLAQRGARGRELPLAAVDDDQVGQRREALVVLGRGGGAALEAPPQHLVHHREVVLAVHVAERRTCGSAPSSPRRPRTRPSSRRRGARRGWRCRSTRCAAAGPRGRGRRAGSRAPRCARCCARARRSALGLRGELGVALRQLQQAPLGAALGGAHHHLARRAARRAAPPRRRRPSSGATISGGTAEPSQ